MTCKILNSSAKKIINRSNDRSSNDRISFNLRTNHLTSPEVIASLRDDQFKNEDSTSIRTSKNG